MVNKEHKLTVDDLIVEYMMYKTQHGYEPSFTTGEFMPFLDYFESKMPVEDAIYENDKLFERFFERKAESDWSHLKRFGFNTEKEVTPHMDMENHPTCDDYIIKANYRLSEYDRSIINTYFMPESKVKEIRKIIGDFLKGEPQRELDMSTPIDENNLLIGKYIAAEIVAVIWDSYVNKQVKDHAWPKQCKDIDKYLLNTDLAHIIGLTSIRKRLLNFYDAISKRIAIMYQQDRNLKISSLTNGYLANSNYKLLTKGHEKMFEIAFSEYQSTLQIDMTKLSFTESHEISGIYNWDEDPDVKTTTTNIGNDKVRKLARNIEKHIKKENI